ncbi:MAG: hypothetical protein WC992_07005 [Acholeplasmataceae bacterium]
MGLLTREGLLAKEELEVRKVDLGKGDYVFVRQMTGRERDSFERTLVEIGDVKDDGTKPEVIQRNEDFRAKLAAHTVCDDKGNLILKAGDYEVLSQNISAKRLEKIITVAQQLNRITAEDKENLVKN